MRREFLPGGCPLYLAYDFLNLLNQQPSLEVLLLLLVSESEILISLSFAKHPRILAFVCQILAKQALWKGYHFSKEAVVILLIWDDIRGIVTIRTISWQGKPGWFVIEASLSHATSSFAAMV